MEIETKQNSKHNFTGVHNPESNQRKNSKTKIFNGLAHSEQSQSKEENMSEINSLPILHKEPQNTKETLAFLRAKIAEIKNRKHKCQFCDFADASYENLQNHLQVHDSDEHENGRYIMDAVELEKGY